MTMEKLELIHMMLISVFISLIASFLTILLHNVGIIDRIQLKAKNRLILEMINCDFCKSFWVSLFVGVVIGFVINDPFLLLCGISATPLTLKLTTV